MKNIRVCRVPNSQALWHIVADVPAFERDETFEAVVQWAGSAAEAIKAARVLDPNADISAAEAALPVMSADTTLET